MSNKKESLIERQEKGVVLVAEGYIFELERRGYLKAGPFVPEVVLEHPEAVKELYHEFLMAGSDVIVACTYYAHRSKLKAVDKEDRLEELNLKSISLAQEVAQKGDALVAGNLSNNWEFNHNDPIESGRIVKSILEEQVNWVSRGNADFIIAETFSEMADFTVKARDMGINYIGICCVAGPHHVRAMAEPLGRKVPASKYSQDINLHPVFGDQDAKKQHYVECLVGPNVPIGLNST